MNPETLGERAEGLLGMDTDSCASEALQDWLDTASREPPSGFEGVIRWICWGGVSRKYTCMDRMIDSGCDWRHLDVLIFMTSSLVIVRPEHPDIWSYQRAIAGSNQATRGSERRAPVALVWPRRNPGRTLRSPGLGGVY